MTGLEFLQTILPSEGVFYLALFRDGSPKPAHKAYTSLEIMSQAIESYDRQSNLSVYHACGSYQEPVIEVEGKRKYRTPENWNTAKAFWLDIDCGADKAEKGQGYATKTDAGKAILTFCATTGLPKPMIVSSGNGLHCYWPLTKAIPHAAWCKLSAALKAILAHHKVLADPTATADFARILRPVGSTNKKGEPKPVKLLQGGELTTPQEFADIIKRNVSGLSLEIKAPRAVSPSINDDLLAHAYPQIPSYADHVAAQCEQVRQMRDTQGDVNYEHWRGVIGIIKHCEEGYDYAKLWSEKRAETGHSQTDTLTRYESWSAGPTSCEFFEKCNPTGCNGCSFKGKITSPIQLGRAAPEPEVETVEAVEKGEAVTYEVPALPKGYGHEGGVMVRYLKNKDDITEGFAFSSCLFYPTYRIRREDGGFALAIRMHLPDRRVRDFELDTSSLASKQKLLEGLAKYELLPMNTKDADMHLTAYLRDSLERLKREAEEINTMTHYGWTADLESFLLGDRLYHKDGTIRRVLLGANAKDRMSMFPEPRGTAEGYAEALNFLYAAPGQEYMQYALASDFGSALTPLSLDLSYRGLLFAIVGQDSGRGKSTVNKAGGYFFGDGEKLKVEQANYTINFRNAILSTLHNITYNLDEITNLPPEELSELAYTCSAGSDKGRMTTARGNGVRFAESFEWASVTKCTANHDLLARLAGVQGNTLAEAVRMIQINVDHYPRADFQPDDVAFNIRKMQLNMGAAGDRFLRYVVPNRDHVMEIMKKWAGRISAEIDEPKFRFYRSHVECSMAAVEITNFLGITQFDLEALFTFVVDLIKKLSITVAQQNTLTPEDALSTLINDLSPRIIYSVGFRDGRDKRGPETTKRINGAAAGRFILGNEETPEIMHGKLYLVKRDFYQWCSDNRVDDKAILDYAERAGILIPLKERFTVGRGTDVKTGNVPCFCIDQTKLESMVGKEFASTWKVVNGGKAKQEPEAACA